MVVYVNSKWNHETINRLLSGKKWRFFTALHIVHIRSMHATFHTLIIIVYAERARLWFFFLLAFNFHSFSFEYLYLRCAMWINFMIDFFPSFNDIHDHFILFHRTTQCCVLQSMSLHGVRYLLQYLNGTGQFFFINIFTGAIITWFSLLFKKWKLVSLVNYTNNNIIVCVFLLYFVKKKLFTN